MYKYSKKNGWSVVEQISTEPSIKPTKISEFEITDYDGNDVTYEYLEGEEYNFMIISHKLYGDAIQSEVEVSDTTYVTDTIVTPDSEEVLVNQSIGEIKKRMETVTDYSWDKEWLNKYIEQIKPLTEKAKADGHKVSIVLGGADKNAAIKFAEAVGINADYYSADDILLKTIVRSNPGIVLWKDGKIVYKWHISKLPEYESISNSYLK